MRKLLLAVGVIAAGLTATGAAAQTPTTVSPYPGGPTTTVPGPTFASLDLGTKICPSTFDISFTQFSAAMTQSEIDGIQGDDQRPTGGIVTKSIETTSAVSGPNGEVGKFGRIRVNGRLYPPKPLGATHTITVRGTGLNGAPRTVTATFRLAQCGSTTTRTGLARTGTFALQWAPLGLGLLGIGYLLMLAGRRRRAS